MTSPLLAIQSDQAAAAELLGEIARICAARGARWHPELRAEVREGAMRLLAPPGTVGPLIELPTALLVPIQGARWRERREDMELAEAPDGATPEQRELLQLHGALYNATGKLRWWRTQHPARLVESSSVVAEALAPLKPHHGKSQHKPTPEEAIAGFLATRSFGWKPGGENGKRRPVLMPLIDLLNHHHRGAHFQIDSDAMRMACAQPDDSGECFAHYGRRRDGLDLALQYGHADASIPFAHCAPLAIAVEGMGWLRVDHQLMRRPIHPLDPPRVTLEGDGVRLSHLCCHLEHPGRVRTLVRIALQGMLQRAGHGMQEAEGLAQCGLERLGAANLSLLKRLAIAAEGADHPGGAVLAAAARRQASIIAAVMGGPP